jgi:two-component system alkaline phosphatase synthesis response regulator PhoP
VTISRPPSVLLVEDETNLARGIAENLAEEGLLVDTVAAGRQALDWILARRYDLVILDVMLPDLDGLAICELARQAGSETPILFLSAKGAVADRVRGLRAGGDDYLAKPFHLQELLLRVKALVRRRASPAGSSGVIRFQDNEVDPATLQGRSYDGRRFTLTQKEVMVLKVLAERPGEVVSRDDLLARAWEGEHPTPRTIDNFILRLRRRFEPEPERPRFFHSVWGVGYRFTPQGEEKRPE